jgi:hypothetical protein
MARSPVPAIRSQDYDAFRRIPTHDLPGTFAGWDNDRDDEEARIAAAGDLPVRVDISPNEFAAFCRAGKKRADPKSMAEFVAEIFRRQEHERARKAMLNGPKKQG